MSSDKSMSDVRLALTCLPLLRLLLLVRQDDAKQLVVDTASQQDDKVAISPLMPTV